jgi:Fe-S cluster assembly iron-binding protein IscA
MLQIDDEAVEALRELGPVRIRGIEAEGEVELEIEEAAEPVVDDQVVERDGVRVFLDPVAASALDDQVFGVHAHDDHVHFTFDDQSA